MVEIWETHHLREENRAFQIFCIPDWNLLLPVLLLPEWCCCPSVWSRQRGPVPAACWELKEKLQPAVWAAPGHSESLAWVAPRKASEEAWRSPCCQKSGWTWAPCLPVRANYYNNHMCLEQNRHKAVILTVSSSGSHLALCTIPSRPQSVTSLHQPSRSTTSFCR